MLSFDRDDFPTSGLTTVGQIVMNVAAPFLPEEIITNILKRLPVKSLVRFQCVCKYWKNLFKTPSFITDHLLHSGHHNPSLLFFKNKWLDRLHLRMLDWKGFEPLQLRVLDCEMQVRDVQNAPPLDSLPCGVCASIIGSSNGLLCVAISKILSPPPSFLLWNPATRDVREVPRSGTINSCVNLVLGFGFSSVVNDYKIVVSKGMRYGVEVYSLSNDSWKEVESGNFLEHVFIVADSVVSPNGAIFWVGLTQGDDMAIVSFDIAKEMFSLIPLPTDLSDSHSYLQLIVYKDKLAILDIGIGSSPNIDLWVMDEDIGWTRKFTGGPYPWMLDSGGNIRRNEIVMSGKITREKESKRGLCLVNITTNEFKMLAMPELFSYDILNYVESLVPIGNIQH